MSGKITVSALRERIDRIDAQVLRLLNRRARLTAKVGESKKMDGAAVYDPARERRVYERLFALNEGPLGREAVRAIYREVISASRALQRVSRVAYLGPQATFTHMAARERFGSLADFRPLETVPQVFAAVERGEADYGVVPVENSSEGGVGVTLDMFVESPLTIVSEVSLEIRHCLLSRSGNRQRVRRVVAHAQSLAQCRRWLAVNLPGVPTEETTSNGRAAQIAAREASAAAVAGRLAAEHYDLKIVAENIQDQAANFTRFLVIGNPADSRPASGRDKTSVLFSAKDEVGVLFRLLKPFAENQVNLLRIESRPLKGRPWEYLFFLDVEGHRSEDRITRALDGLAEQCVFMKVLGSYPGWR